MDFSGSYGFICLIIKTLGLNISNIRLTERRHLI